MNDNIIQIDKDINGQFYCPVSPWEHLHWHQQMMLKDMWRKQELEDNKKKNEKNNI